MKYDVTFTEQAENDLRGIFEYIAFDLLSPENATGQLDRIEEKILSLGEYPEKFRQYEREPWNSRNTRVVPVDLQEERSFAEQVFIIFMNNLEYD